jgi:hypothetical protein
VADDEVGGENRRKSRLPRVVCISDDAGLQRNVLWTGAAFQRCVTQQHSKSTPLNIQSEAVNHTLHLIAGEGQVTQLDADGKGRDAIKVH